jgi:hypothetical protein
MIKHQRLNSAVHLPEGTECKPHHNHDANIHKQQRCFPFEVDVSGFDPIRYSDKDPKDAYEYYHL